MGLNHFCFCYLDFSLFSTFFFFKTESADAVFIRNIFERLVPLLCSIYSFAYAYTAWKFTGSIYKGNLSSVATASIWMWVTKKKNDCMSEGNIKMNSSALPWLHRSVSIRSVHWAGIFHFIHHLQLAAMILQDQSIPLAHTKRNTQNSPC